MSFIFELNQSLFTAAGISLLRSSGILFLLISLSQQDSINGRCCCCVISPASSVNAPVVSLYHLSEAHHGTSSGQQCHPRHRHPGGRGACYGHAPSGPRRPRHRVDSNSVGGSRRPTELESTPEASVDGVCECVSITLSETISPSKNMLTASQIHAVQWHRLLGRLFGTRSSEPGVWCFHQYSQSRNRVFVPAGRLEFAVLAAFCHAVWQASDIYPIADGDFGKSPTETIDTLG